MCKVWVSKVSFFTCGQMGLKKWLPWLFSHRPRGLDANELPPGGRHQAYHGRRFPCWLCTHGGRFPLSHRGLFSFSSIDRWEAMKYPLILRGIAPFMESAPLYTPMITYVTYVVLCFFKCNITKHDSSRLWRGCRDWIPTRWCPIVGEVGIESQKLWFISEYR